MRFLCELGPLVAVISVVLDEAHVRGRAHTDDCVGDRMSVWSPRGLPDGM